MKPRIIAATLAAFTGLGLTTPMEADAQFWDKVKETAEGAAEGEVLDKVDELARGAVRCAFDDLDCIQGAKDDGEEVVLTDADGEVLMDEEGQPITDPAQLPPEMQAPSAATVDANYDFEPGERVLFASDFMDANVGDFPPDIEWIRGNMAVVDWEGRRLLQATSQSVFAVPLPETLPDQFTVEFVVQDPRMQGGVVVSLVEIPGNWQAPLEGAYFNFGNWRGSGVWIEREPGSVVDDDRMKEELVTARIMADGAHMKVYLGQKRVANVPNVEMPRGDRLYFSIDARDDKPLYLGEFRVAAGGRDLYDALEAEGRVAVRDILFDTDQATIKPESAERLTEIGGMLAEHPDLSLLVEGHTDGQGGFEHNMELSKQRADAVKAWLVEQHGIAPERLRTLGLGPTQPVADNDTEEGRAENRRVELVRLDG